MTIPKHAPFLVRVLTTGENTTSIRLQLNGAPAGDLPLPAGATQVDFPYPQGLDGGTYTFRAVGANAEGEGPPAEHILIVSQGLPAAVTITILLQP